MIPGRIEGANLALLPPVGMDDCLTLHVKREGGVMVSSWQLTPVELALLNNGGRVHLYVWGAGHPPVALTVAP